MSPAGREPRGATGDTAAMGRDGGSGRRVRGGLSRSGNRERGQTSPGPGSPSHPSASRPPLPVPHFRHARGVTVALPARLLSPNAALPPERGASRAAPCGRRSLRPRKPAANLPPRRKPFRPSSASGSGRVAILFRVMATVVRWSWGV